MITAFALLVGVGTVLIVLDWDARDVTTSVAIRELWTRPEQYLGEKVRTDGTLRVFLSGTPREHYAIEDANQFRVGVRGISRDELHSLLNQPVRVDGRLTFTPRGLFVTLADADDIIRR